MKVNEVREILKGLSQEQISELLLEIYRKLPKAAREAAGVDGLLRNPPVPGAKRAPRPAPKPPDLEDLRFEAEWFLEDAYAQNYFAPNRNIPKKDRPKWRFIVMRLYKGLLAAAADPAQRTEAADLLHRLYKLLYSLLWELFARGQKDLLLREYDEAAGRGVRPREGIRRMVEGIRETGRLPPHFG